MRYYTKNLLFVVIVFFCGCAGYKPPAPSPLVNFKPTLNVQQQWSMRASQGTSGEYLKLTPAIVDNKVFVNSYVGEITAVDANSGHKIWKTYTKMNLTSGLAAGNGMLFIGNSEGQVLAYQQSNGAFVWWAPLSSQVLATPGVNENVLLVKAENGQLSAFNINNAKQLWVYSHDEPTLILRGGSSPQVFGNKVVTGFASGELVVIDLHDGQFIWREPIAEGQGSMAVQRMVNIDVNPKIFNGIIYVATYQGKIAAVNLKSGKILWQHKLSSYSGLAVDNERVYVSDEEGHVWAFDRETGDVIWKQNDLSYRKITGPALVSNAIVVGDGQGYLHFMSPADGHFIARVLVHKNDGIIVEPITAGNSVFVYTQGGRLARFDVDG
ncbi:MAG: hypothetical protein AMJ43_02395 [Coxiella sp. DG_40]|nr:MAG: hypothetical protein AMJ43_02395 [Coxiella sp. DG_40]